MKVFRRQNPILTEMLLSLLFFAVSACIIICVFVSAYTKNEYAVSGQEAVLFAQNIAEDYKANRVDFNDYFEKNGWVGDEEKREITMLFSKTQYRITVEPIKDIEYINGFELIATDEKSTSFSFRVEVLTNDRL